MKGYKAFDSNLRCRGVQFEVGKTYKITGALKICENGYHFCQNLENVYGYYPRSSDTRICEIEAVGETVTEQDKSATSEIKIVRELSVKEKLDAVLKSKNSGNRNSGNRNSGYGNSGNRNSGDWNSGDGNSGYFNTTIPVYFFNKPSTIQYTKELENKIRALNVKPILTYIYSEQMTEEEKKNNPTHKITGGFLRKTDRMNWTQLTESDKSFIKSLPNFDNEIFKVISNGVSLLDETIEVEHNGQKFKLDITKAKELGLLK